MLYLGASPINDGAWDVVILLNGGWRIVSGQIPYVTFHTPVGPLIYLLVAFGMKVVGPSTAAIPLGTVLLAGCLLPWAWSIAAPRFPPFLAFVYTLFSGFLLIAPRPLGLGIRETSYAMIYNREGDVLISMLFILLFLPRLKQAYDKPIFEGLSIGFLLALILYCKVTYFIVACASVPLGVVSSRPSWKWLWSIAAGFIGIGLVAFLLFRIGLWAYIRDVMSSGHAQSMAMRMQLLKYDVVVNLPWLYLIFVCLMLWTFIDKASGRILLSAAGSWLIAAWPIGVSVGLDAGNTGGRVDNPLFFISALIPLEGFRRRHREQMQLPRSSPCLVQLATYMIILPHFCFQILFQDASAFAYANGWDLLKRSSFDTSRQLHARPLRDLRVPPGGTLIGAYWYIRDFPDKLNDGLDLLRKHLSGDDRVTTFGYVDPFSFAFGLKPCRDINLWWDLNQNFTINVHPAPDEFLGSATLVMVPIPDSRYSSAASETLDAMMKLYKPYLQENFELVDTSQAWLLYRRRSASPEGVHPN